MTEEDWVQQVVGRNEVAFRNVNESMRAGTTLADADKGFPFTCECGLVGCSAIVRLTLPEYEGVRAHPRRFFVVEGHEVDGADIVVERHAGYLVVEKTDLAGRIAEAGDPRG